MLDRFIRLIFDLEVARGVTQEKFLGLFRVTGGDQTGYDPLNSKSGSSSGTGNIGFLSVAGLPGDILALCPNFRIPFNVVANFWLILGVVPNLPPTFDLSVSFPFKMSFLASSEIAQPSYCLLTVTYIFC
jgi:hypothetical protein